MRVFEDAHEALDYLSDSLLARRQQNPQPEQSSPQARVVLCQRRRWRIRADLQFGEWCGVSQVDLRGQQHGMVLIDPNVKPKDIDANALQLLLDWITASLSIRSITKSIEIQYTWQTGRPTQCTMAMASARDDVSLVPG